MRGHVELPAPAEPGLGGKGDGLSRLLALGLPVPPAVVIPVDVFRAALSGATAGEEARWLADAPLPGEVTAAIEAARLKLGDVSLAVRSSAVGEDGGESSFAGAHETVLDVRGAEAVLAAVRVCWASAFSARALAYRRERGAGATPAMAVVLQRFVEPDFAGVAFTADPVTGVPGVVVEYVAGRGDALVSGRVAPTRAGKSAPPWVERVVLLARRVEERLGGPQDLEWAVAGDELFLLQARPITAQAKKKRTPIWSNVNASEVMPGVLTPMSVSIAKLYVRSLLDPFLAPFRLDSGRLDVVGLVAGRAYFNLSAIMAWMSSFPGVRANDATVWARVLGGSSAEMAQAIAKLGPDELPSRLVSPWRALRGAIASLFMLLRHHRAEASGALAAVAREADALEAVDLGALKDDALVHHLRHALGTAFGPDDTVIACAGFGMGAVEGLRRLCASWFGDHDGALAGRLMTGIGGFASAEAGMAIDRLADRARALGLELLSTAPQEGPPATNAGSAHWEPVAASLEGTDAGRAFLADWAAFMARHGHHARGESDVAAPRWREQPDVVLAAVRAAIASNAPGLAARERRRQDERVALVAELERALGPLRRGLLRAVLRRVEGGLSARENGRSEAVRRVAIARASLLELGRRLVTRDRLDAPNDVFFFSLEELGAALDDTEELRERVIRRRGEMARWRAITPPSVVMGDFDPREAIAPPLPHGSAIFTGIAASPGVVEGIARVLIEPGPGDAIQPGEILVAPFTDPGWTPLFINAAGLVTDYGGLLSHGSVVAREYGLPAVVNTHAATVTIRTGQRVRVDGNRGEVALLDSPAT
ncbi:MAG: pyruvate, phosphate dikinase [Myxococcaceae bacterium]